MTPADLTNRQREVAALVARGRTSKRIAFQLGISVTRVNIHISAIAFAINCPPDDDERVAIALWWRACKELDPAA